MECTSRPHWSYSSINQYANICSLQFYFQRVAKLPPERVSSNLIFGSAIHAALDEFVRNRDIAAAKAVFETRVRAAYGDKVPVDGDTLETLLEKGPKMLDAYAASLKDEEVVAVSREFAVPLVDRDGQVLDRPLVGELDLVVKDAKGRLVVVDWKTAARRKSDDEVAGDLQATVYSYAIAQLFDERPLFRFDVLLKTKEPAVERYYTARDERDFKRFVEIVKQVERGVAAGVHIPADRSYFCSGCGFKSACARWADGR